MRNSKWIAAALFLSPVAAQAADLPARSVAPIAPAAVVAPVMIPTWAGAYVGADVGYSVLYSKFEASFLGYKGSESRNKGGFAGGLYAGYNWQNGAFVYGLELGARYYGASNKSDVSDSGTFTFTPRTLNGNTYDTFTYDYYNATNKISWTTSLKARAGYSFGNTLVYLGVGPAIAGVKNAAYTGGVFSNSAVSNSNSSYQNLVSSSKKTKVGLDLAAGVEHKINNVVLRGQVEYMYFGKQKVKDGLIADYVDLNAKNSVLAFTAGAAYKF